MAPTYTVYNKQVKNGKPYGRKYAVGDHKARNKDEAKRKVEKENRAWAKRFPGTVEPPKVVEVRTKTPKKRKTGKMVTGNILDPYDWF